MTTDGLVTMDASVSSAPNTTAVSLTGVSVDFPVGGGAYRRVLDDFSLSCLRGEFVALIGASGCGKTTILNVAAGLLEPSDGEVSIFDAKPRVGRPDVGYMFARDGLLPWRTARQNVELGLEMHHVSRAKRRKRALGLLASVGLADAADKRAGELSQGMRQRVALARTWATEPRLLLMDEPFAALDAQTRESVRAEFLRIWDVAEPKTVLFVTHDLAEAITLADRVVAIGDGRTLSDLQVPFDRPRVFEDLQFTDDYRRLYKQLHADLLGGSAGRADA